MRTLLQILQVRLKVETFAVALFVVFQAGCGSSGSAVQATSNYQRSEGFSTNQQALPSAVSNLWNSVYLVLVDTPDKYEIGSAFLTQKIVGPHFTKLFFVTNRHVVEQFCELGRPCPHSSLSLNGNFVYQPSGLHLNSLDHASTEFTVIKELIYPDLAMLSIEVPNTESIGPTINLARQCDITPGTPVYAIGFPDTSLRTAANAKPIDAKTSILKRWSQGVFVRNGKLNPGHSEIYSGSSVDSLPGNSGGPLLNAAGELVGVMVKSSSLPGNSYVYSGRDEAPLDYESASITCKQLQALK